MRGAFILIAPLALLAGCGQAVDDDTEVTGRDATGEAGADPSGVAPAPPARMIADAAPVGNVRQRSVYGEFDLTVCTQLSEQEEGEGATWRCPGRDGVSLFVQSGDGRFDLDAGAENDKFQTVGAFNEIAETVEYRMANDEIVAVIFRYRDVSMQNSGRTVLAVEKVGTEAAPGCRVAQIGGGAVDANGQAQTIADRRAADFDCTQEPVYIGNAR